jgi:hypothetical protein
MGAHSIKKPLLGRSSTQRVPNISQNLAVVVAMQADVADVEVLASRSQQPRRQQERELT